MPQMVRPPIKALLIDLSGTLHVGSSPTPGAVDALAQLRTARVPFRFCSNTSKEGRDELQDRLRKMGFALQPDGDGPREMWTSLGAVSGHMRKKGLKRPFCLLEDSARKEILGDLDGASADLEYDSVVVGLAPSLFTYDHLNVAFRVLLSQPTKPLIATHRAKYVRVAPSKQEDVSNGDNTLALGPGPFIAALEAATGAQAEVLGKPTTAFFETVIESFGEEVRSGEGRIAIVGDDVETDLGGGASDLGLWRVLVKTGKYRPGDENRSAVAPPDEIHDSFASFVQSMLRKE